jgi:hypothetical protein
MENLTNNNDKPKADARELVVRWGLPILGILGAYFLMPIILNFLRDTLTAVAYSWLILIGGGSLALATILIMSNWTVFSMKYRAWCASVGRKIIKQDPIAFMRASLAVFQKKLEMLGKVITDLVAGRIELQRERNKLAEEAKSKYALAAQMRHNGDMEDAANEAGMAKDLENTIMQMYDPLLVRGAEQEATLKELQANWERSIKRLKFTVDNKEREFNMLKQFAKAYGAAEDFANGNTEANQIYNTSLKALEERVSGYLATIEEFERATAPKRKAMATEKQMLDAEGLSALEEYSKSGKLSIQEDFSSSQLDVSKLNQKNLFAKTTVSGGKKAASSFQSQFSKSAQQSSSGGEFEKFLK